MYRRQLGPVHHAVSLPVDCMLRAWLFTMPILILSVNPGPSLSQGIDSTVHDLTGGGVDEICVFCHTPHAANTDVQAPLWNKTASGATYTLYDSTTIDGTVLAVGSVSVACLSCHDGTQSTDVVINAPGSRGVDTGGVALRGGDRFLDDPSKADFLGTDLSDDHPIGIQYGGFVVNGSKIDSDFVGIGEGLNFSNINGQIRWWVDTGAPGNRVGVRDKTDMVLYSRDNGGAIEPFVECATCHDPHSDQNEIFLRIANTGSQVCVTCHVK